MSQLEMDEVLAQTAKAVAQMNQPAAPGEATREYYREQGRQQERQRMTETEAIRENYNLGVLAGEAREQARIIKLLGEDISEPDEWFEMRYDHIVALIKGENK